MNYLKLNRRAGILTISSVFLLLIAGGVVRSTGSGMGCPDWPKCYGRWFPPTCNCDLPANYQDIFLEKRLQKAEKFANLLRSAGMSGAAEKLMNDPGLKLPEVFNPYKAWTEYVNRIVGVLAGLFSLIFLLSLLRIRKHVSKLKFYSGVAGFIMMIFNAWFGSIVVATNLFPVTISIHYIAAYAVLALFMISMVSARVDDKNIGLLRYKWFYVFFLSVSLIQIIMGTMLRERSESSVISGTLYAGGNLNTDVLGEVFDVHWIVAILLVAVSLIPVFVLRKKISAFWYRLVLALPVLLGIQYLSGVLNLRFEFPAFAQVSHIFFAGACFGITLYICISSFRAPKSLSGN